MGLSTRRWTVALVGLILAACGNEASRDDSSANAGEGHPSNSSSEPTNSSPAAQGSPNTNRYSWDGSWSPVAGDFPLDGLFDETHAELPPGKWGWDGSCDCPGDEGLAIYDNEFVGKGLDFATLEDDAGRQFGWRLIDTDGGEMQLDHRGDNFEGTPYTDIVDLGPEGELRGTGPDDEGQGGINLGDGPDMLRYGHGVSVDLRSGSEARGGVRDNDLVILGGEQVLGTEEYDITGTTVHTGPGSDLVFARNFAAAAIDLGNGAEGRTDSLDPSDGDDVAVLGGNMRDFRVFGGHGDDVFVWHVLEVDEDRWLGPSFFGGGGWGDAVWGDPGADRLVLVVPADTEIVGQRGDHDGNWGSLLAMIYSPYEAQSDAPMEGRPLAQYYGNAPVGPNGEHTLTLSFRSSDERVFTHDFYMTAVEELQLGAGDDAAVYRVDSVSGTLTLDPELVPYSDLPDRAEHAALFDAFAE